MIASKTGWQSGVWSCIMLGLPKHEVQELNASTVCNDENSCIRPRVDLGAPVFSLSVHHNKMYLHKAQNPAE